MQEEPLIWTTKGNVPVASLEYATRWEFSANNIKFVETYKSDGEVVKENVHVCILNSEAASAIHSNFN